MAVTRVIMFAVPRAVMNPPPRAAATADAKPTTFGPLQQDGADQRERNQDVDRQDRVCMPRQPCQCQRCQ